MSAYIIVSKSLFNWDINAILFVDKYLSRSLIGKFHSFIGVFRSFGKKCSRSLRGRGHQIGEEFSVPTGKREYGGEELRVGSEEFSVCREVTSYGAVPNIIPSNFIHEISVVKCTIMSCSKIDKKC